MTADERTPKTDRSEWSKPAAQVRGYTVALGAWRCSCLRGRHHALVNAPTTIPIPAGTLLVLRIEIFVAHRWPRCRTQGAQFRLRLRRDGPVQLALLFSPPIGTAFVYWVIGPSASALPNMPLQLANGAPKMRWLHRMSTLLALSSDVDFRFVVHRTSYKYPRDVMQASGSTACRLQTSSASGRIKEAAKRPF